MKRLNTKIIYYIPTGARRSRYAGKIIRELLSEGASVITIPTEASLQFLDIKNIKAIKGNIVKTDWNCNVHLPKENAILIAPCTANTLNSIAAGITNTYPLCIIASAIGNKTPIFIAPSMNNSLWNHPVVQENIRKLEKWNCRFIWPEINQNLITMADVGKILDTLYFSFTRVNYRDKKIKKTNDFEELIKKNYKIFRDIGKYLSERKLNSSTAGCLSVKVDNGFLVTTSGSELTNIHINEIAYITSWNEKSGLISWMGDKMPSSETPLHCVLHQNISKGLILHFHCSELTYSNRLIDVITKRYLRYGTFKIGHEVLKLIKDTGFMILKSHGEVVVGSNTTEIKTKIAQYRKKVNVE